MSEQPIKEHFFIRLKKHPFITEIIILIVILLAISITMLIMHMESRVYIENAQITTPIISLNSPKIGVLDKTKVEIREKVHKGAIVATVNDQSIRTLTSGIIVDVLDAPGETVTPQTTLVKMIDPSKFELVGQVDENKGLADIKAGQQVVFTVDAFGNKKYEGMVNVITPTAHASDVVFSISDKRATQQFDVRVTFNAGQYPELKNGMSAKMWVYK